MTRAPRSYVALMALTILWSALGSTACRSKAPTPESKAAPSASASVARAPTPPPPPREPPNAPTEEDFEEEAESITAKNLEDELDKLEKELSAP
ncbi:MAG TPA: hypothetical protein VFQ61_02785 [Polyangiaceae bacterium]|nr:hypothetical protein [Polyangiaceae bacterium]